MDKEADKENQTYKANVMQKEHSERVKFKADLRLQELNKNNIGVNDKNEFIGQLAQNNQFFARREVVSGMANNVPFDLRTSRQYALELYGSHRSEAAAKKKLKASEVAQSSTEVAQSSKGKAQSSTEVAQSSKGKYKRVFIEEEIDYEEPETIEEIEERPSHVDVIEHLPAIPTKFGPRLNTPQGLAQVQAQAKAEAQAQAQTKEPSWLKEKNFVLINGVKMWNERILGDIGKHFVEEPEMHQHYSRGSRQHRAIIKFLSNRTLEQKTIRDNLIVNGANFNESFKDLTKNMPPRPASRDEFIIRGYDLMEILDEDPLEWLITASRCINGRRHRFYVYTHAMNKDHIKKGLKYWKLQDALLFRNAARYRFNLSIESFDLLWEGLLFRLTRKNAHKRYHGRKDSRNKPTKKESSERV